MQDINLTPDKVLDSLLYRSPFCVITWVKTIKNGPFSWLKFIGIFGVVSFLLSYAKNIVKYGDIQNISFTSDKELNILVYW